jgi:hypothetical protein
MATTPVAFPGVVDTMLNASCTMTADGKPLPIIQTMVQSHPLLNALPCITASDKTFHRSTRQTSVPSPTWHKIGGYWSASLGTFQQVDDNIGLLKDRYAVTSDVVKRWGSAAATNIQNQLTLKQEGFGAMMETAIITGTTAGYPERIDGFDVRYTSTSLNSTNYRLVILNSSAGTGTGSYTSIYLVQPGVEKCHLIVPDGVPIGTAVQQTDKGEVFEGTIAAGRWTRIVEFDSAIGLAVPDMTRVKRIANIYKTYGNAESINMDVLMDAQDNFKDDSPIIAIMHPNVITQLRIDANKKGNVNFTPSDPYAGKPATINGMSIVPCRAISIAESTIS